MKLWMVRGGKQGEHEPVSLENNLACIGFESVPDLSQITSKTDLRDLLNTAYPDATEAKISNILGQLFAFAKLIESGDIIAMPLKHQPQIALGVVTGNYQYRIGLGEFHHIRPVNWIRTDAPRDAFGQDLLYSLGAIGTVCQIQRNDAVKRVKAILEGSADPEIQNVSPDDEKSDAAEPSQTMVDLAQVAQDRIRRYVGEQFKKHDLARLVNEVLQAEGYVTHLSPPGPDGGVDILARRGSLGFDGARLCVQVKSSASPADVNVLRSLQGTMSTFKADEGLLVSWGGFNQAVMREARLSFFSVRLWGADDLLAATQRNYERLPEELRKEIPLKQIWTLVLED